MVYGYDGTATDDTGSKELVDLKKKMHFFRILDFFLEKDTFYLPYRRMHQTRYSKHNFPLEYLRTQSPSPIATPCFVTAKLPQSIKRTHLTVVYIRSCLEINDSLMFVFGFISIQKYTYMYI